MVDRLIETDRFPIEFLSAIAQRESWRKEVHRPIYHLHKWWAKRLGSVFRGILLGCSLPPAADLAREFYRRHDFGPRVVFDPFLGSGTTMGEAHKLGFTALGRDINPVAVEAVRVALGPLNEGALELTLRELTVQVGQRVRALYRTLDSQGREAEVLYYFWVMQASCPGCQTPVDLFSSYVMAQNAYPARNPEIRVVCPGCDAIFTGVYGAASVVCPACTLSYDPGRGPAHGTRATCPCCQLPFTILEAIGRSGTRPQYRLYGKLVLTQHGAKEYLPADAADREAYRRAAAELEEGLGAGQLRVPTLALTDGHNTRQALSYNFRRWRDFFNDRQLLALSLIQGEILRIKDDRIREVFLLLFSGALEFNNLFASYKGEGTGAVRHMFSHHILKPERTPIEANVWGTPKSSGSFAGLCQLRLQRALAYRRAPTEVNGAGQKRGLVCSDPFTGVVHPWPTNGEFAPRGLHLACGDSAVTGLPDGCVDLVVTDPPFFDNVHYSELADFFHAWQQLARPSMEPHSTRDLAEVQDADAEAFAYKLGRVLAECRRVLRAGGLLVFSYHHSRPDGWLALARGILTAGFRVVSSLPVRAELAVAAPKSQAREPIGFDILLVCRKAEEARAPATREAARVMGREQVERLCRAGFELSAGDGRVIRCGQALTCLGAVEELSGWAAWLGASEQVLLAAAPVQPPPVAGAGGRKRKPGVGERTESPAQGVLSLGR